MDDGNRRLTLIEAKSTRTPKPDDARPMRNLADSISNYEVNCYVAYRGIPAGSALLSLVPGVQAVDWQALHSCLQPAG